VERLTPARPKGNEELVISLPVPLAEHADLLVSAWRQRGRDGHFGSLPACRALLLKGECRRGTTCAHLFQAVREVVTVE